MKKIFIIALIICMTSGTRLFAQEGSLTSLQYSMGFAMGDFKDYIGDMSWRGINFDYRKLVTENVGVGFDIGWNFFNAKEDYASYTKGTETVTGVQYRYCHVVPILASADYYFKPGESVNPFVGISVGTEYSHSELDMGLYYWDNDIWHFAWKPEAGILLKPSPEFGLYIAAKYYNALKTDNSASRDYLSANIGFVWEY